MSVETEKAILPHGWIVKTSQKYPDRVYYFNLLTGCSTWECPELVPKPASDGFKEPESKKNLNRSFEREPEMGRLVAGIHTPEESPNFSRPRNSVTNNNDRKSLKRPLEEAIMSPTENTAKFLKPPTAIVNPVTTGPEKKPSTNTATSPKELQTKKMRKSKKKNKNQLIPLPVLSKKKEKSPKSGQKTSSTSTNSSTTAVLQTSLPTPIALRAGSSMMPDDYEDSFCEDVEMMDVSANLPSVEETVAEIQGSNQLQSHYIVVDTNIFMHELDHIEELKDTPLQGCGPPHIFIPWVVFKELDGLKLHPNLLKRKLAFSAIKFIHKVLKSKHPRFHGQNAKQAEDCKKSYHKRNDDKIIDLCQILQKKAPPEKVILLTNDKNLANIAMVYNIIAHDWESLMKDIKPDVTIIEDLDLFYKPWTNPSLVPIRKSTQNIKEPKDPNYLQQKSSEHILIDQKKAYEVQIDKMMERAQQLLKDVLDPLLVKEMRRVYDDKVWDYSVNRNCLQEIVAAYIKHWPTLFCHLFSNDPLNCFEILHKKLSCIEGQYNTLEDCFEVLNAVRIVFEGIRVQDPKLLDLVLEIEKIKIDCTHIFRQRQMLDSSLCIVESNSRQNEQETVLEIFNYNWSVVNDICGMIMDFYGVQHSFAYSKPETIPPESEYRRVAVDLFPFLQQLKQLMMKMLINVKNSDPSKVVFKKLCLALKDLVPSLNIKFVMPDVVFFTPIALENFCRRPENRQKIEIGFKQLDQFCAKLKEAIQAMIAQKKPQTSLLCDKSF